MFTEWQVEASQDFELQKLTMSVNWGFGRESKGSELLWCEQAT